MKGRNMVPWLTWKDDSPGPETDPIPPSDPVR